MKRVIATATAVALFLSVAAPVGFVAPARADFNAPPGGPPGGGSPPPSPPPSAPPSSPSGQSDQQQPAKQKSRAAEKAAIRILVCLAGKGLIELGRPVPLKKMSKRQWQRYLVEVEFHKIAGLAWSVGCGLGPNVGFGVVIGAGAIAALDFHSRFIAKTRPIKRTPRQEAQMFCRDGSSRCPRLVGPDPDLYGPP